MKGDKEIFGSPAVTFKLKEMAYDYNHKRVEMIMPDNDIRSKARKMFKAAT